MRQKHHLPRFTLFLALCPLLLHCDAETPTPDHDAIVGIWSNDALCKGGLWLGYLPDGQDAVSRWIAGAA